MTTKDWIYIGVSVVVMLNAFIQIAKLYKDAK